MAQHLEDRRLLAAGPYPPAAGELGTTAVAMDDPALVGWATGVADYAPGDAVDAKWQDTGEALGSAEGTSADVVSLGRGGQLTLTFEDPIRNGIGPDFAVFENSFNDTFLELGFVEVSSDGANFVRFPNDSLTPEPVGVGGSVDPTHLDGFAGKYRQGFGTPFDLEQLIGASPLLNTGAVTHIRLVDVIGDGSNTDTSGEVIYDPYPTAESAGLDVDAVGVLNQIEFGETVVGFEDVGAGLSSGSAWNGPDPNGQEIEGPYDDTAVVGEFESGELSFNNAYSQDFGSWNQWAYSNQTDTTTAGFTNQFSVFTGVGASESKTFGIGNVDVGGFYDPPTIELADDDRRMFDSLQVTNTTYAALSMLQGDLFAKEFGGPSGDDPDWFLLTVEGKDAAGDSVGVVDFYLADYRFEDNSLDYIVDEWTEVDLAPLREARSLEFMLSSSDVGDFGMNTPAYFAADDVVMRQPVVPLDLAATEVSEADGEAATTARVSRISGDTSESLVVTLSSSDDSVADVPESVTIPAGETYAEFAVAVSDNDLVDGDRQVRLRASAEGLLDATTELTISDDDVRTLTVSLDASEVSEAAGASATTMTVARNDADVSAELKVTLTSNDPEAATVPDSATIPADSASVQVPVTVIDDKIAGADQQVALTAAAADYVGGQADLKITEDDVPQLSVSFAAASIGEADGASATVGTVTRNTADLSQSLEVTLSSSDTTEATVATAVTISAGSSSADFAVDAVDDQLADAKQGVDVAATAAGFASATGRLDVLDDEQPTLRVDVNDENITEGGSVTASVSRNDEDLSAELVVQLAVGDPDLLSTGETVTIVSGARSAEFTISAVEDSLDRLDRSVAVTASAEAYVAGEASLKVADNDQPSLSIDVPSEPLSEAAAPPTATIEQLGKRLPPESFNNGADGAGGFVSAGLQFNNSYNETFGSWSGWSYANTTDTTTAGFGNQYSAIAGGGAAGSSTYAVATAFPGSLTPTVTREPSREADFQSLSITNTTYAALSMREGDAFAKKFGGESGDDPDWFLLTIEGFDSEEQSVGMVDFYLADYRFDDNSLDYIVDQWTTVDISSLSEATELAFSLSSSDVGDFGMNTPAYFALDNVVLASEQAAGVMTVSRNAADPANPLDVTLTSGDDSEVQVPRQVTIPAGASSIDVPLTVYDDIWVDGDQNVKLQAQAAGHEAAEAAVTITDDDAQSLTLSLLDDSLSEADAPPIAGLEDIGRRLGDESFYHGSDGAGGFASGPLQFNNDYNPEFGVWSGWSVSNTTDTTTAGFGNQYSAYTGGGARGSSTYAVANAFPGGTVPSVEIADGAAATGFASMRVTNTTYTALSMLHGDQFGKKFGGETGDDPDWLLLTVEGFDGDDQPVGSVEFYLADYRFENNSLDYIVDRWAEIDLSGLNGAVRLDFQLSSSDVGDFGMNTPAYFAADQIRLIGDNSLQGRGVVHRNSDAAEPLVVDLASDDPSEIGLPEAVTIPAGQQSAEFFFESVDDLIVDGEQVAAVEATATAHQSDQQTIRVLDDDQPALTLWPDALTVNESDGENAVQLTLHRNDGDLSQPLTVQLASSDESELVVPSSVTIEAGASSAIVMAGAVDDPVVDLSQSVQISASATGYASADQTITVENDDVAGVQVAETEGGTVVSEAEGQDRFDVSLKAKPSVEVVVTVSAGDDGDITTDLDRLTFTPENWDQPQTITVSGTPDLLLEPDEQAQLELGIDQAASDPDFADAPPALVTVTVEEYFPAELHLTEDGDSVVLSDQQTGVRMMQSTLENGIAVTLDDRGQTFVVHPLPGTSGPVEIETAGGDDTVEMLGDDFSRLDGGGGYDELILRGQMPADLAAFLSGRVSGFEKLVLGGDSSAEVTVDAAAIQSVLSEQASLGIHVDAQHRLLFEGAWTLETPEIIDSQFMQIVRAGEVSLHVANDTPWRNVLQATDVNNDGRVSALDALIVINRLNRDEASALPTPTANEPFGGFYFDVSGDNHATALDALRVINHLNRSDGAAATAEGEPAGALLAASGSAVTAENGVVPEPRTGRSELSNWSQDAERHVADVATAQRATGSGAHEAAIRDLFGGDSEPIGPAIATDEIAGALTANRIQTLADEADGHWRTR